MRDQKTQAVLAIVGGLLTVIGAFMPWVTATAAFVSLSRSGLDQGGDGIILLIIGVAIAILALGQLGVLPITIPPGAIIVLAVIGGFITWINFVQVSEGVAGVQVEAEGLAIASVGAGLYVSGVGLALSLIAGWFLMRWALVIPPESEGLD